MQEPLEGAELKRRRRAAKMTQAEVGAKLGVSGSAVGQWESGATHPSWKQAAGLAEMFGPVVTQPGDVDLAPRLERLEGVVRGLIAELAVAGEVSSGALAELADRMQAAPRSRQVGD